MEGRSSTQAESHTTMQSVSPLVDGARKNTRSPSAGSQSNPFNNPSMDQEQWKAGRQEMVILLTLSIISLIVALDSTIFLPALHVLARDLHGDSVATFWVGTSYLLANAAFLPLIGAVSDIFGRRELLMGSLLLFTIGTIICCAANDFGQLLAGRVVQGVGGGGISTLSLVVLTDIVPLRQRPKYQSLILMAWGLGTMLGPLIGGLISQNTTWRWLFYINFPFCGIGMVVVPLTVRLQVKEQRTFAQKLARVDWVGGGLFIGGTASFLLGLTWGGIQHPWSSYQAWLPILLGLIVVVLCLLYEGCFAKHPFLPVRLFSSISASVVFFGALVLGLVLYANSYYLALYLESVKGLNEILTGVCNLVVNFLFFPTSILTGVTISKRGAFLWAVWVGWVLVVLGEGLLLVLDQSVSVPVSVVIICVSGIGAGSLISSLNSASQSIAHAKDAPYAVTMFTFMRTFGMCLGVAIGGAVFENALLKALADRNLPTAVAKDSAAFVAELRAMEYGEEKMSYRSAYVEAFHGIFYVGLALSAFCLALTFLVKHHNMDIGLTSDHKIKENKTNMNEHQLVETQAGV